MRFNGLLLVLTLASSAGAQGLNRTDPPLADLLAGGWEALGADDFDGAARWYTRATRAQPRSEDAWLGLQRSHLGAGRFDEALAAGETALAIDPESYWALSRQAFAHALRGDQGAARTLYERALVASPGDAGAMLGLGFALAEQGEAADARGWCERAGAAGAEPARVDACVAFARREEVRVTGGASLTAMGFSGDAPLSDLVALTVRGAVELPQGLGVWVGATLSDGTLASDASSYEQTTVVAGLTGVAGDWAFGAGVAHVTTSEDSSDGTTVLTARIGHGTGAWSGALSAAVSLYPDATVLQLDPVLAWRPNGAWTLTIGPSIEVLRDDAYGDGETEWLVAGRASLTHRLTDALSVSGNAFVGAERYRVESAGLSVWTGSERYTAGYGASIGYSVAPGWTLSAGVDQRFGDQVAGEDADLSALSGTLGLGFEF